MSHGESLLSFPWHLLAKKRAGTATVPELTELAGWLARHAPTPLAAAGAGRGAAAPANQARLVAADLLGCA